MRKLERLRREALDSCNFRGHTMTRFVTLRPRLRTMKCATCKVCDKGVYVNPKPYPNEIEISGEAVALGCTERKARSRTEKAG